MANDPLPFWRQIKTQPNEDDEIEDNNLLMTPYKDMHYMDLVKNFRKNNQEMSEFYGQFEVDRQKMQR